MFSIQTEHSSEISETFKCDTETAFRMPPNQGRFLLGLLQNYTN
jgi:hypothetical protein